MRHTSLFFILFMASAQLCQAAASIPDNMRQAVERDGFVRIIVGLDYPALKPNASDTDMASYRAEVKKLQDAVIGRAELNATEVKRFSLVPGFGVTVDAAHLERLAQDPSVATLEQDGVNAISAPGL